MAMLCYRVKKYKNNIDCTLRKHKRTWTRRPVRGNMLTCLLFPQSTTSLRSHKNDVTNRNRYFVFIGPSRLPHANNNTTYSLTSQKETMAYTFIKGFVLRCIEKTTFFKVAMHLCPGTESQLEMWLQLEVIILVAL